MEKRIENSYYQPDNYLHLLEIYLTEWTVRSESLFKQAFTYFYTILIIISLPYIEFLEVQYPKNFPKWIFPIVGIMLSIGYIYVMNSYCKRLACAGEIYNKMIRKLPESLRRTFEDEKNVDTYITKTWLVCELMFGILMVVGIVAIVYTL